MALHKAAAIYIFPTLCVLQYIGIIGFCLYKLHSHPEKSELCLAIICSVLGFVSAKAHLATKTKKRNVVLSSDSVGLES